MSNKLGKGGTNLASLDSAYRETNQRPGRYADRTAKQPKEAGKGRVAKARRAHHGSSRDTLNKPWVEPASGEQVNPSGGAN